MFPLMAVPIFLHAFHLPMSPYGSSSPLLALLMHASPTLLCTHHLPSCARITYPLVYASLAFVPMYHHAFRACSRAPFTRVLPCSLCLALSINTGHFPCSKADLT